MLRQPAVGKIGNVAEDKSVAAYGLLAEQSGLQKRSLGSGIVVRAVRRSHTYKKETRAENAEKEERRAILWDLVLCLRRVKLL